MNHSALKTAFLLALTGLATIILFNVTADLLRFGSENPLHTDFYKFHLSAVSHVEGESPYWANPNRPDRLIHCWAGFDPDLDRRDFPILTGIHPGMQQCLHPNLNPPIFVALTLPLALVDFDLAWQLWTIFSALAGMLAIALLAKTLGWLDHPGGWAMTAFLVLALQLYFPAVANLQLGQVTNWLLLPLVLCWTALRRNRLMKGAFFLGLLLAIKPFFGLLLPGLLILRQWRVLGWSIAFAVMISLIGAAIIGAEPSLEYIALMREVTWLGSNWNASAPGFFHRLLASPEYGGYLDQPGLARALSLAFSLGMAGWMLFVLRSQSKSKSPEACMDWLFTLALPLMLLLSPLGWMYYLPLVYLSGALLLHWSPAADRRLTGLLLMLAIVLTAFPTILVSGLRLGELPERLLQDSLYFYVLLGYTFLVFRITRNSRIQDASEGKAK